VGSRAAWPWEFWRARRACSSAAAAYVYACRSTRCACACRMLSYTHTHARRWGASCGATASKATRAPSTSRIPSTESTRRVPPAHIHTRVMDPEHTHHHTRPFGLHSHRCTLCMPLWPCCAPRVPARAERVVHAVWIRPRFVVRAKHTCVSTAHACQTPHTHVQVVALVDVLSHPDLAGLQELLIGG
jgi:hypothetical protein